MPSPDPEPSCDCATGEDCHANGAAAEVQDSYDRLNRWQQASTADTVRAARSAAAKLRARHVPLWTLVWKGDRFEVTDGIATAETDVLSPDATVQDSVVAINSLVRGMRLNMIAMESVVALQDDENGKVTPIYGDRPFEAPPAPDLAARLDGLKAAVDALAERLERKAGRVVRVVKPTSTRVVSGQGLVWVVDTRHTMHRGTFDLGDLVTRGDSYETMVVIGIDYHGGGPLIGLTVRKAEG